MWVQAAGSWSVDARCAVPGNECTGNGCWDHASSSDWLFGLWDPRHPGPPQRFQPTGNDTRYQHVMAERWPLWGRGGSHGDLSISSHTTGATPGGSNGYCSQGQTYDGTDGEICGGDGNWGATGVEVWYPR